MGDGVGSGVTVGVGDEVGVSVGDGVEVAVGGGVGVAVAGGVGVAVGGKVTVIVGGGVGIAAEVVVGERVGMVVGVRNGVWVGVWVDVGVGVVVNIIAASHVGTLSFPPDPPKYNPPNRKIVMTAITPTMGHIDLAAGLAGTGSWPGRGGRSSGRSTNSLATPAQARIRRAVSGRNWKLGKAPNNIINSPR